MPAAVAAVAQQHVVPAVAVEVADARHGPRPIPRQRHVAAPGEDASPAHRVVVPSAVGAPHQHVVPTVAVHIADARHGHGEVAREARRARAPDHRATNHPVVVPAAVAAVAQQHVVPAVAIEVPQGRLSPHAALIGCTTPVAGHRDAHAGRTVVVGARLPGHFVHAGAVIPSAGRAGRAEGGAFPARARGCKRTHAVGGHRRIPAGDVAVRRLEIAQHGRRRPAVAAVAHRRGEREALTRPQAADRHPRRFDNQIRRRGSCGADPSSDPRVEVCKRTNAHAYASIQLSGQHADQTSIAVE